MAGWPRRCFERLGSQEDNLKTLKSNYAAPLVNPDAQNRVWATRRDRQNISKSCIRQLGLNILYG